MNIYVNNLNIVSGDSTSKIKFILLEDGTLLFGKCKWHKDLVESTQGVNSTLKVIAAGVIPNDIVNVDLESEYWGGWESTGYKVVTPEVLRNTIRESLLTFSHEINSLYK